MYNLRTVLATFNGDSSRKYSYYVPKHDDPKVGDLIVTSISWTPDTDYSNYYVKKKMIDDAKIARIVEVEATVNPKATKFYLSLISLDTMKQNAESNEAMLESFKKKEEARKKLDTMLRDHTAIELYRKLADTSDEARELLRVLES